MAALTLSQLQPRILAPVDLHIDAGGLIFISGPSGSGKSLLLRAIADLDPNRGEVLIDDHPRSLIPAPEWRRRVGLLPAETGWWADRVGMHFATPATTPAAGPGQTLAFGTRPTSAKAPSESPPRGMGRLIPGNRPPKSLLRGLLLLLRRALRWGLRLQLALPRLMRLMRLARLARLLRAPIAVLAEARR